MPLPDPIHLRLPATSANLGSGFDAAAVALGFFLDIKAEVAPEFSILASGRDALRCSDLDDNLILGIYRALLEKNGRPVKPIAIRMTNEIPLGMGCGSSAAGRLAAIALAVHFGQLGWSDEQILEEASALEGHPDNAAACWLGGFVTAATEGRAIRYARVPPPAEWRGIVVMPSEPLATSKARAVLPLMYSREDVIANLQSAALLGLAFAQCRGDLLRTAMRDRIHQPYRTAICPLLPRLLPLAGHDGIFGAALSGAGPAVLLITENDRAAEQAAARIRVALQDMPETELLFCGLEASGAQRRVLQTSR